ncbi:hypothetical protein LguiB_001456 [Lonicera macranthoides]
MELGLFEESLSDTSQSMKKTGGSGRFTAVEITSGTLFSADERNLEEPPRRAKEKDRLALECSPSNRASNTVTRDYKDQTYFLSHLLQAQLRGLIFPLGCIPKDYVPTVFDNFSANVIIVGHIVKCANFSSNCFLEQMNTQRVAPVTNKDSASKVLNQFNKQGSVKFDGTVDLIVAQQWIHHLKDIFEVIECSKVMK